MVHIQLGKPQMISEFWLRHSLRDQGCNRGTLAPAFNDVGVGESLALMLTQAPQQNAKKQIWMGSREKKVKNEAVWCMLMHLEQDPVLEKLLPFWSQLNFSPNFQVLLCSPVEFRLTDRILYQEGSLRMHKKISKVQLFSTASSIKSRGFSGPGSLTWMYDGVVSWVTTWRSTCRL